MHWWNNPAFNFKDHLFFILLSKGPGFQEVENPFKLAEAKKMNLRIRVYLSETKGRRRIQVSWGQGTRTWRMNGTQDRHFPLSLILWPLICAALCTSILPLADLLPLFSMHVTEDGNDDSQLLFYMPFQDQRKPTSVWFPVPNPHEISWGVTSISKAILLQPREESPLEKLGAQTYLWWGRGHFSGTRGQWAGQRHLQSVSYPSIKCKGASSSCAVHRNRQGKSHIFKPVISEETKIWTSKKMIPDSQGHMADVPRSTDSLQKWKNPHTSPGSVNSI